MQTPLPARRPLARKLACAVAAPSARAQLFRGAVTIQSDRQNTPMREEGTRVLPLELYEPAKDNWIHPKEENEPRINADKH